jgi:hypothetical protein
MPYSRGPYVMPRNREGASTSGRLIVQKFAAHVAYLLNDAGEGAVVVNHGELYRKLLRTLSGGGEGRGEGNPYVETLIAINLVWGDFCQGGAPRVLSIFLYLSFFVRPVSPFLRPDPTPQLADARRSGQRLAAFGGHRKAWP